MKSKILIGLLIALATGLIYAASAFAWTNAATATIKKSPACNSATGKFHGKFKVVYHVNTPYHVDSGYTIATIPDVTVKYPKSAAGTTQSYTFTVTETKYFLWFVIDTRTETVTQSVALPSLGDCALVPPVTPPVTTVAPQIDRYGACEVSGQFVDVTGDQFFAGQFIDGDGVLQTIVPANWLDGIGETCDNPANLGYKATGLVVADGGEYYAQDTTFDVYPFYVKG